MMGKSRAHTIGGSVAVLDTGIVVVWGSCRGFQSVHVDEDVVCLQLFNPAQRQWSTVFQVSALCSSPLLPSCWN